MPVKNTAINIAPFPSDLIFVTSKKVTSALGGAYFYIWTIGGLSSPGLQWGMCMVVAGEFNNNNASAASNKRMMRLGIAADHGGFTLKVEIMRLLHSAGYEVEDFGAFQMDFDDDYPDFTIPLAQAVAEGRVERGIAVCGSGVGACIAANKITGVRAGLVHDSFSAHQGVEDDDMNMLCLGARVTGPALALELVDIFLSANFSGAERHQRRLAKLHAVEVAHR